MNPFREEPVHRRRRGPEDDGSATSIDTLPPDILYDILSRLPITSLVQFRCVSRAWRLLAAHPHFVSTYFSAAVRRDPDPLLLFHALYPIQNQLAFADRLGGDPKVKKFSLPFLSHMPEFDVVGSCNGLLCLFNSLHAHAVCVYNPFTRDHWALPPPPPQQSPEVAVLGFGFSPCTREYKVVRIVYFHRNAAAGFRLARRVSYSQSQVQLLTLGGGHAWRCIGRAPHQIDRCSASALVAGRLHWVTPRRWLHGVRTRIIVSFDLADERFREVPKPCCGGLNRWNFHLLALAGRLAAVVCSCNGKLEVWVLQDYDARESWTREYSIGSYLPSELKHHAPPLIMAPKNVLDGKFVRILCLLKNGKILLEYWHRVLVSYDPKGRKFEDLSFRGLPKCFQTIVHVGSLNLIHTPIDL